MIIVYRCIVDLIIRGLRRPIFSHEIMEFELDSILFYHVPLEKENKLPRSQQKAP